MFKNMTTFKSNLEPMYVLKPLSPLNSGHLLDIILVTDCVRFSEVALYYSLLCVHTMCYIAPRSLAHHVRE